MDATLRTLCEERRDLLGRLAPLLTRVGASYGDRSARNRQRAKDRKAIRQELEYNAVSIVATCMQLYNAETSR